MILYKIVVAHYSQKDNHRSIEGYIIRENEEQAMEYVCLKLGYYSAEELEEEVEVDLYDDDGNYVSTETETKKEKLLRLGGDYFDADADRSDLYYGHTEWGWEEVKTVTPEEIEVLRACDILDSPLTSDQT
jgi:hypothetical protein